MPIFPIFMFPGIVVFAPCHTGHAVSTIIHATGYTVYNEFTSFPGGTLQQIRSTYRNFRLTARQFIFTFRLISTPDLLFSSSGHHLTIGTTTHTREYEQRNSNDHVKQSKRIDKCVPPPQRIHPIRQVQDVSGIHLVKVNSSYSIIRFLLTHRHVGVRISRLHGSFTIARIATAARKFRSNDLPAHRASFCAFVPGRFQQRSHLTRSFNQQFPHGVPCSARLFRDIKMHSTIFQCINRHQRVPRRLRLIRTR